MKDKRILLPTICAALGCLLIVIGLIANGGKRETNSSTNQKEYLIKFDTEGGSTIEDQKVKVDGTVIKPSDPTKENYVFIGWQTNGVLYDFDKKVEKDMTLVAIWEKAEEHDIAKLLAEEEAKKEAEKEEQEKAEKEKIEKEKEETTEEEKDKKTKNAYTITFNTNGDTTIKNQTVMENEKVKKPDTPTKKGYKFLGWYLKNKEYNFNTPVTDSFTLEGKWEEVLTEKIVKVTESIPYTTRNIDEVNMLKGNTKVIQAGVNGKKEVEYIVVYNLKNEEVSRKKKTEKTITEPVQKIQKVGVSDFNLNTDTIDQGSSEFCPIEYTQEITIEVDGVTQTTRVCSGNPSLDITFEQVSIKNKQYWFLGTGNGSLGTRTPYTNVTSKITKTTRGIIYNGKEYLNAGGMGGSGIPLTEALCKAYGFSCGRW